MLYVCACGTEMTYVEFIGYYDEREFWISQENTKQSNKLYTVLAAVFFNLNFIKMTIAQIKKASKENKYLGLRFNSGHLMGINSKCVEKAIKRSKKHLNSKTEFQSYKPLTLNEYINCKHPFL